MAVLARRRRGSVAPVWPGLRIKQADAYPKGRRRAKDELMRETVTAMLELQELEIILEESKIVHRTDPPRQMAEIQQRIVELRRQIPDRLLRRYDGHRRTGLGAVQEAAGLCRGCNLNVPQGDLNRMKNDQMHWICPNCGRFLLLESEEDKEEAGSQEA